MLNPITNNKESNFLLRWPADNMMSNVNYSVEISPSSSGSLNEPFTVSNITTLHLHLDYTTLYNISILQRYCKKSKFILGNKSENNII